MRKLVRWIGRGVAALLVLGAVAAGVLWVMGGARLARTYDLPPEAIPVPSDSASVARGRHLAEAVTLCQGCHGEDLGGEVLADEPLIVRVYASNLTSGRGGVGSVYTDADYVRAIRHGVNRDGRGLMIMHSDMYNHLGAEDLGALVAYVRSVPPVDREHPSNGGRLVGRILLPFGVFDAGPMPLIAAEVIDHEAPVPTTPEPGPTAAYGGYLVSIAMCRMCHGSDLNGGLPIEPEAPPGPSLLVYGMSDGWTEEQFLSTVRTGTNPGGRALDGDVMPYEIYGRMTDEELRAIRAYIASLAEGGGSG